MSSLTRFNSENLNDCGKPIFELIGDNGGEDNVFTHFEKSTNFNRYTKIHKKDKIYIEGCIIRNPRDITRQISQNCRLQKVSSTVTYQLQGSFIYTPEKVDEIERIFHSKLLTLNGIEIQFQGGEVFTPLGEDFPNQFRLNVTISECLKWQIFGCSRESNIGSDVRSEYRNELTFGIPTRQTRDVYFSDAGLKIADSYPQLIQSYENNPSVISVEDVDVSSVQTDVRFAHIFKVRYEKTMPDAFYYDKYSPANKVYGLQMSEPEAYNELSRGMNAGLSCGNISVADLEIKDLSCANISISGIKIIEPSCAITVNEQWEPVGSENFIQTIGIERYLSLNILNTDLIGSGLGPVKGSGYEHYGDEQELCTIPLTHTVECTDSYNVMLRGLDVTNDYDFVFNENSVDVTPCIVFYESDTFKVLYRCNNPENDPFLGAVASIGLGCAPTQSIILTSEQSSEIPVGSSLEILTSGLMIWSGECTHYDQNGGYIRLSNVKII